jgi:capsular exopolysaccharide synthesis family protein
MSDIHMDIRDFLRVVRRRWLLIVALMMCGAATAQLVTMFTQPQFEATSELFVAVHGNDTVVDLNQGNAFAQGRVASYVMLATSPKVINEVNSQLGVSAGIVKQALSATNPDKTVLINIRATSTNAKQAAQIANAAAAALVALVGSMEETGDLAVQPVSLRKVQDATVPAQPFAPAPVSNLAVGILLGLASGLAVALLVDRVDTRLRGREAVESLTDASVLGALSEEPNHSEDVILRSPSKFSPRAESFRQLRTHLQFANVDGGVNSILVTSSIPSEGKSTTSANLAIVLAQSGLNVLLVDADLRRPTVAKVLGLEGSVGLTTVLTGRVPLADAIQPVDFSDRLSVLTSGAIPPNPSEMLGSATMERTLLEMKKRFDIVIIDSPPLVSVSDASALASLVSGVLLVASVDGRLHREQFCQSLETLQFVKGKLLGLVLNRVEVGKRAGSYYGYANQTEKASAKKRRRNDAGARRSSHRPRRANEPMRHVRRSLR